ncbi:hypothetical protein [Pseudoroseicyclus tamaricis]|uniref:Sulfotransferase family protein n=1 Tax=Pseudoroseicyclus tamaricis TaxID=2705421 RepID=A0A6B2JWY9_9RHOB|nr:hypothetical protein [Pseudoroseicyclus tamaricis]NDU99871.1 hypothetical protein [Pseudoroseicyclus tamaricis]
MSRASHVFVLSAGRTGTTTFARAAAALPGFTAGHESRAEAHLAERLDYPDRHIEADNRLVFFLPQLEARFGPRAHYVYLRREPAEIAASYARRWHLTVSIPRAFTQGVRMRPRTRRGEVTAACRDYADWVDSTVSLFLASQRHAMVVDLAEAEAGFARVAEWIGAGEVPQAARDAWGERHNATPPRRLGRGLRHQLRLLVP